MDHVLKEPLKIGNLDNYPVCIYFWLAQNIILIKEYIGIPEQHGLCSVPVTLKFQVA